MGSDSEILIPPENCDEFESLCWDVWTVIWKDNHAQKNGRCGQAQAGVDVFGRDQGNWVGLQCKQKSNLVWKRLESKELEEEVEKAKTFQPRLSTFIVATTGLPDAAVQRRARELTTEHAKLGLFSVAVFAWREIWHEIYSRPELLSRIGPIYWPAIWKAVGAPASLAIGTAPPMPSIFIGRENDVSKIKRRLSSERHGDQTEKIAVIRGWPGVGKTTLAAALAHDDDVKKLFPDGILWASLGEKPDLLAQLRNWGFALNAKEILLHSDVTQCTDRLAAIVRDKKLLLLIDDVWQIEHFVPFRIAGNKSFIVATTRAPGMANAISHVPDQIYKLDVLAHEMGVTLIKAIVPEAIDQAPVEIESLVKALEGLPLAIRVAGHLLKSELQCGFDIKQSVSEIQKAGELLKASAPPDRFDPQTSNIPTVQALLQKSTDRLDRNTKECFIRLGALNADPLTYDIGVLKAIWEGQDPKPVIRRLVDMGLLEASGKTGRYQMHSLLVQYARLLRTH